MDGVRVASGVVIPFEELSFRYSRSGGPGGQNVNRRETRVELVWDLEESSSLSDAQRARLRRKLASKLDSRGRLRVVASEERTQPLNRERTVERFQELISEGLEVPKRRRPTKPSTGSKERRLTEKRVRSQVKRERGRPDVE